MDDESVIIIQLVRMVLHHEDTMIGWCIVRIPGYHVTPRWWYEDVAHVTPRWWYEDVAHVTLT